MLLTSFEHLQDAPNYTPWGLSLGSISSPRGSLLTFPCNNEQQSTTGTCPRCVRGEAHADPHPGLVSGSYHQFFHFTSTTVCCGGTGDGGGIGAGSRLTRAIKWFATQVRGHRTHNCPNLLLGLPETHKLLLKSA